MTSRLSRNASADELAERLVAGDRLALTRLMSAVEADRQDTREALRCLFSRTGRAQIVGVTGPPGSGKSTLTTRLALEYRARGQTVGIVAVDPTSPYTGGAILGDRVRMMELHSDPGVFVRSMATRGVMGGLARSTLDVVLLLDAFGKDIVVIETVGVGQDEVEIARAADTTLVVGIPNQGDDIQAIKAGILEIADILVVNKADLPGADRLVADLKMMLQLGVRPKTPYQQPQAAELRSTDGPEGRPERSMRQPSAPLGAQREWPTPIQLTVATDGSGVGDLVDRIAEHRAFLEASNAWHLRRTDSARRQVRAIVEDRFEQRLQRLTNGADWEQRFASIAAREQDPYSVADEVLRELAQHGK